MLYIECRYRHQLSFNTIPSFLPARARARIIMKSFCTFHHSRYAYNLKYKSQSKGSIDRAIGRLHKAKEKLGGDRYYFKPKGMHQKTYERLLNEVFEAENVCNQIAYRYFGCPIFNHEWCK